MGSGLSARSASAELNGLGRDFRSTTVSRYQFTPTLKRLYSNAIGQCIIKINNIELYSDVSLSRCGSTPVDQCGAVRR